jgi:DNA-binding CsgD family transcriptional regulator
MGKKVQPADAKGCERRLVQAKSRTAQAEARTEQAKARTESAETRAEQAETRTESAKHRTEQAEARAEQAESRTERAEAAVRRVLHQPIEVEQNIATQRLTKIVEPNHSGARGPLEKLTGRQREILQLIAEGQNTKSIADLLKVSPKTVEYHRMKLMAGLNLHDIPGLVRFALRVGLIAQEQ